MLELFLKQKYYYVNTSIEKFTASKNWKWKITFVIILVSLFFSFPPYDKLLTEYYDCWGALLNQIENPFKNNHYNPSSHEAKTQFRLAVPLIAKLFGLTISGILILQAILGVLTIYFSTNIFYRITKDRVISTLLTASVAFVWAGRSAFIDYRGLLDGYAIFFLISSIYFRHPVLIFSFAFLGAWTDERALIASSMVLFYWFNFSNPTCKNAFNWRVFALIMAWICYFLFRIYLTKQYHFTTETEGANIGVFLAQINNTPIAIWSALEGLWVIFFAALYKLYTLKKHFSLSALSFITLLAIGVSMSVFDITRSMAYLIPIIFSTTSIIFETEKKDFFKKIAFVCLSLCLLYPSYESHGNNNIDWFYPLPIQLFRFLF